MKRETERRIEDGVVIAASGIGASAGLYLLFHTFPYSRHQVSEESQRFNEVIDPLKNLNVPGSLFTKDQISQVYSDVKNLNELNLREGSEVRLNEIVSKLDIIKSATNMESTLQQTQVRTALVGISDQLQGIKGFENSQMGFVGASSLTLGVPLILFCGYHLIKRGCSALKEGYNSIFP